jgi:16S rRNA (cytidine1402-2'-O)-methyltransferase
MQNETNNIGSLYLCATPIGNLEDMTYRAVRVLGEIDLIAAEDTRNTRKLLTHFNIHTPLVSYHEHNKAQKNGELIAHLLNGENIAVVSDAGLPGIADPGSELVRQAIDSNIRVIPLPGANAALSALICSGLDTTSFVFIGFLPKTGKKRRELLEKIANETRTMLFYESPHRLKETLAELAGSFGAARKIAVGRELTKKFEEFIRGTLGEIIAHFDQNLPRGEFCLVVEGGEITEAKAEEEIPPYEMVQRLMAGGKDKKAAIKETAVKLNMARRDVYKIVLEHEEI